MTITFYAHTISYNKWNNSDDKTIGDWKLKTGIKKNFVYKNITQLIIASTERSMWDRNLVSNNNYLNNSFTIYLFHFIYNLPPLGAIINGNDKYTQWLLGHASNEEFVK